jgi:hypothetical protein
MIYVLDVWLNSKRSQKRKGIEENKSLGLSFCYVLKLMSVSIQVLKKLRLISLRMRGRQDLGLLRRRQSMPPPSLGIP